MTGRTRQARTLRGTLSQSALVSGVLVFVITFPVALYLGFQKSRSEEVRRHDSVQRLLGELIAPSLAISDYSEIRRLLGQASEGGEIFAVITDEKDFLVSDYETLPLLESSFNASAPFGCGAVRSRVKFKGAAYEVFCSPLEKPASLMIPTPVRALQLSFHTSASLWPPLRNALLFGALASAALVASLGVFLSMMRRNLLAPLEQLTSSVLSRSKNPLEGPIEIKPFSAPEEINTVRNAFVTLNYSFREAHRAHKEAEQSAALYAQARQIAHDIRSPLAALKMLSDQAAGLCEERRVLLREAINRIGDIANNLLGKTDLSRKAPAAPPVKAGPCLVSAAASSLLSEKRVQYRDNNQLEISETIEPRALGLFVDVERTVLKRILSNILDNACEAIEGAGCVQLSVTSLDPGHLGIRITDTGRGIPTEVISKVFDSGYTLGKPGGSGLGLAYCKQAVEANGGSISIESRPDHGTAVTVRFPVCKRPEWYPEKLEFAPGTDIVIADDDNSVHRLWDFRFEQQGRDPRTLKHFYETDALIRYVEENRAALANTHFFVDQEFLGSRLTGLETIRHLHLQSQSTLVTNLYEEDTLLSACVENHIKLLPKSFVPSVQLEIGKSL